LNLNPLTLIRGRAYRATFNNPQGRAVLADLRRFCRASVPTADVNNVQTTYLLEGRREVWCRIQAYLNLTDEDIINLIEDSPNE